MGGVLRFAWNKTLDPDILWNSVVWFILIFKVFVQNIFLKTMRPVLMLKRSYPVP